MSGAVHLIPVPGLPEVEAGADLAALIAAYADLRPGDVVTVAQKVVSKAEGAVVRPPPGGEPGEVRRHLARLHARRIVADTPQVLVTETAHGFVCANGGVDGSNAPDGACVLLPDDPDASAQRIREGLAGHTGLDIPVLVTDTFGRPWRVGQTDVAIGVAGLAPVRDERGGTDRGGVTLTVTEAAVADELAAAADLVRRKADGVPVVVVRGFEWHPDDDARARDLVRAPSDDLFRRGSGQLALELAGDPAGDPADPAGAGSAPPRPGRQPGLEPLQESDVELVRRVAARAGAVLRVEGGAHATALVVVGDRLAAGLVVAALLDRGCAADWCDEDGVLLVEAGRTRPQGGAR